MAHTTIHDSLSDAAKHVGYGRGVRCAYLVPRAIVHVYQKGAILVESATYPLAKYPFVQPIDVRFRDLDALGHVNHAVYLTYFETVRIGYYHMLTGRTLEHIDIILAEMRVSYHAPTHYGDTLAVGVQIPSIGTKSFVMEYMAVRSSDGQIVASGQSVQVVYDYAAGRSVLVSDSLRTRIAEVQKARANSS